MQRRATWHDAIAIRPPTKHHRLHQRHPQFRTRRKERNDDLCVSCVGGLQRLTGRKRRQRTPNRLKPSWVPQASLNAPNSTGEHAKGCRTIRDGRRTRLPVVPRVLLLRRHRVLFRSSTLVPAARIGKWSTTIPRSNPLALAGCTVGWRTRGRTRLKIPLACNGRLDRCCCRPANCSPDAPSTTALLRPFRFCP